MKALMTRTKDWLKSKMSQARKRVTETVTSGLGKVGWVIRQVAAPMGTVIDNIPGGRYMAKAVGLLFGINLVILPPLSFVAGLSFGLGYALWAALVSIPMYFWLLATSLQPWASLFIGAAVISVFWWACDWTHLHYGEADGDISELTLVKEWPAPPVAEPV
jgi:hypothetical protein